MKKKGAAPEHLDSLEITDAKTRAAGFRSIVSMMRYSLSEMNVIDAAKTLSKLNQKGGIDCQSCAWADPAERTLAEFCENGGKALADEATTKRLTPSFFAAHTVHQLAGEDDHQINAHGRITHPMILRENSEHYEPITWEDALETIAEKLNSLSSPDEAVFYTSGRTSNEAAFLYQLFVRQFGTNNMPDCSNMCHESTSVALAESIGLGKATIRLEDLEDTDLIIIIGQNPGTNAPRMMSSLQNAKQKGAKIIAINPLPEAGLISFTNPNPQHYGNILTYPFALIAGVPTPLADLHLPVRIGGDMAVLKGILKTVLASERTTGGVLDREFIDERSSGFSEFEANLQKISWDDITEQSGLSRAEIETAAQMFINADRVVSCWAMGITQHEDAVATIQDIVNLHLLRGQIGKSGAGLCPVRGHSNVQGDRTMGIWEQMNPVFRANLDKEFSFKTPPKDGFDVVESIRAMHDGRASVFFAMGGNFLSAAPDTEFTAEALRRTDLTVQVITKLNRTALAGGKTSIILPCLGRSEIDVQETGEQFVTTENTMLQVQMSEGVLEPASEHLRSEPWIVANLAKRVLRERTTVDWDTFAADYDLIRESISRVVPGTENFNEKVREPGGFFLPNPPRDRIFNTDTGRAKFTLSDLIKINLKNGELMLTSIRAHSQFNTTIYEVRDRYRGIYGTRRVILMNPEDIKELGFSAGDVVDITSRFEGEERFARKFVVVPYQIPRSCAATYFPEANSLTSHKSTAKKSNCPTSKLTFVTLAPHNGLDGHFISEKFDSTFAKLKKYVEV